MRYTFRIKHFMKLHKWVRIEACFVLFCLHFVTEQISANFCRNDFSNSFLNEMAFILFVVLSQILVHLSIRWKFLYLAKLSNLINCFKFLKYDGCTYRISNRIFDPTVLGGPYQSFIF